MLKKLLYTSLLMSNLAWANAINTNHVITLPLIFEQDLPITYIKIQNKSINALIDTGSSNTTLSLANEITRDLNLTYDGKDISFYNGCGKKSTYRTATLSEMQLGNSIIKNVTSYVYPSAMGCGTKDSQFPANIKSILGINLLKNYKVIFDYSKHYLVLVEGNMPPAYSKLSWRWLTFKMPENGNIIVNALINNKRVNLILDTGSSNSLLDPDLNIQGVYSACPQHESECKLLTVKNMVIDSTDIGQLKFLILKSIKTHTMSPPYDGFIGSDLLKKHRLLIDFRHHMLAIENL